MVAYPSYFPHDQDSLFAQIRPEEIALGKKLFFDKRLSLDSSVSCGSCHIPDLAFADTVSLSPGIKGRTSSHNSPTLLNVGFLKNFMFDMRATNLEIQPMVPIHDTNEMGSSLSEIQKRLSKDPQLRFEFKKTYQSEITSYYTLRSIAQYMRSLISASTKYDQFILSQDSSRLSFNERKGMNIFFEKGKCNTCHTSPLFTNGQHYDLNLISPNSIDVGKMGATHNPDDLHRKKVPTLRNITKTYPYFHNGIIYSLDSAIAFHLSSQRKTRDFSPPSLNEEERGLLIAFLHTLSDAP